MGESLKVFDGPVIRHPFERPDANQYHDRMIQLLLKSIHSHVLSIQLGTYVALNKIVDILVERDQKMTELDSFDVETLSIRKFEPVLKKAQNIVNVILMDFK